MIEATAGMAVLAFGLLAAVRGVAASLDFDRVNAETGAAFRAARQVVEEVRAEAPERLAASYDDDAANDPDGRGTAPGRVVAVPALGASSGVASPAAEVILPFDDAGRLREDLDLPALGLPRDLNGDGVVDGLDHTSDAVLIPFAVRVTWTGSRGDRSFVLEGARCR